jgi:putative pyruvate formate lyase activating enzyme
MDFPFDSELLRELHDCAICPRNCHADRFSGTRGYCSTGASFSISSVCIHRGEEPAISGPDGICNVFFTGCNLQCIYCQNWQISDKHFAGKIKGQSLGLVLDQIIPILDKGIGWLGFVSPSHQIPQMKLIISELHKQGYNPKIVFNTNGYDKAETIRSLEEIVDVYLPDFKYRDGNLSAEYSDASDYPGIASAAIREMYRQKGSALHLDEHGRAVSGIIIRHLVLPGHVENSLEVLRHIAQEISPKLHISLMSQYFPTPRVSCHPKLNRTLSPTDYRQVTEEMEKLGMHNGWIQEMESTSHYKPDFDRIHPFEESGSV